MADKTAKHGNPRGRAYCNTRGTACFYAVDEVCVNCLRPKGWRAVYRKGLNQKARPLLLAFAEKHQGCAGRITAYSDDRDEPSYGFREEWLEPTSEDVERLLAEYHIVGWAVLDDTHEVEPCNCDPHGNHFGQFQLEVK